MRTPEASLTRSYSYGWQQFTKYFLHLFLVGLIVAVVWFPASIVFWGDNIAVGMLAMGYALLVVPVVRYGARHAYLKYMRDEHVDIRDVLAGFRTNYLNIILANLLVTAICGIGFVLLFIPGIVFACRLVFVPYLVMDKGLDPVAAIEKSWNMTRGHGWRIFAMYLVAIPLFLIGLALIGIGSFFAGLIVSCAFASLYYAVDLKEQALLNANGNGHAESRAAA
jgi:uncharacterized membrane protein